jgi:cysteine desulfurase
MTFYEKGYFPNPSSIYKDGVEIKNIIEQSRKKIAELINAHSDEIIFTCSGTESDALAILGVVQLWKIKNNEETPHIITTKIEHPAVLENFRFLEKMGKAEVSYISVNKEGIINLEEFKNSLKNNTILVSVMYANNEIGTIQPIEEVAKIIRHFRKQKHENQTRFVFPIFHTDACQAMNYLFTENIEKLGVDLMSFNSSKIYGPKGIGVLYKKRGIELLPLYMGGGQEFGLRSGTESLPLITGFTEALNITNKIKQKESKRLIKIRDYGIKKLLSISEEIGYKIILNGDIERRLPNNINISISGISSELLVIELSAYGICISEKSACKSDDNNKSYVIEALRKICPRDGKEIEGSLRISLGRDTQKGDIDNLIKALVNILNKYKKWTPLEVDRP